MRTVHEGWDAAADPRELSLSRLFKRFSDEATSLVHTEIELAKAELAEKGKVAGAGAGMFGGAAAAALCLLGALTACLILALDEVMHPAVAALIVTILWALVAGALAYLGRERVRKATPIAPQRAQEGIREDLQAAKEGLRAGRAGELETMGGTYR
jgi:uncharacterized membrane protein YqjE